MKERDWSTVARWPVAASSCTPPTKRRVTSITGAESGPNASMLNAAMMGAKRTMSMLRLNGVVVSVLTWL